MEIPKEIEHAIIRTYVGWKNKYELIKVTQMTAKKRKLYSRGLRMGGICYVMEQLNFTGEVKQELENMVGQVDAILEEIRVGSKTSALNQIKDGLIEYANIIKRYFPDIYDKHKDTLTWK